MPMHVMIYAALLVGCLIISFWRGGAPERIGALFRRTFAIWEREWAGADAKRLVRVGAVQAAWFDASQRTIRWCLENGGVDTVMQSFAVRQAAWDRLTTLFVAAAYEPMLHEARLADLPSLAAEMLAGKVAGRVVINPRDPEV